MGVHQKIDRMARRHFKAYAPGGVVFPSISEILHFEGKHGPDGIKRKSPARDEPWHYIDPHDPADDALVKMIENHLHNLTRALKAGNAERAAFEAAWLAHAVTDGLTPAHHYPLEAKLEQLRGEGIETRVTTKEKLLMPGLTVREQVRNNWEYWGAKGIMTTHLSFELGVATTMTTQKLAISAPSANDVIRLEKHGFTELFYEALHTVAAMDMYAEFARTGWTRHLARETREKLLPTIIRTVCLAWVEAAEKARPRGAGR